MKNSQYTKPILYSEPTQAKARAALKKPHFKFEHHNPRDLTILAHNKNIFYAHARAAQNMTGK